MVKEKKETAEAEYEYIGKRVKGAQEKITKIKRRINEILMKTGV